MFSVKKLVFLLALLLVTLLPNVVARPTYAQEGVVEEEVKEKIAGQAGGEEVVEEDLACRTSSYSIIGYAPNSEPVAGQFFLSSGCGGTVRVLVDRGTYMRAIAAGRAPGAWVHVPANQVVTIAAWLPAGTWVTVQIRHIDTLNKRFSGTMTY